MRAASLPLLVWFATERWEWTAVAFGAVVFAVSVVEAVIYAVGRLDERLDEIIAALPRSRV